VKEALWYPMILELMQSFEKDNKPKDENITTKGDEGNHEVQLPQRNETKPSEDTQLNSALCDEASSKRIDWDNPHAYLFKIGQYVRFFDKTSSPSHWTNRGKIGASWTIELCKVAIGVRSPAVMQTRSVAMSLGWVGGLVRVSDRVDRRKSERWRSMVTYSL